MKSFKAFIAESENLEEMDSRQVEDERFDRETVKRVEKDLRRRRAEKIQRERMQNRQDPRERIYKNSKDRRDSRSREERYRDFNRSFDRIVDREGRRNPRHGLDDLPAARRRRIRNSRFDNDSGNPNEYEFRTRDPKTGRPVYGPER